MEIITDVDGVLLNFDLSFDIYMSKKGYGKVPNSDHIFNLAKKYRLPEDKLKSLVIEFANSENFEKLYALRDSIDGIKTLSKSGAKFIAVTSCGDSSFTKSARIKNLESVFGNVFNDVICLPLLSPKSHILEKWKGSKKLWIEDHYHNAIDGSKLGLRSVLVDHHYNKNKYDSKYHIYRTHFKTPWSSILEYSSYIQDYANE
jgi:hypothetical protein